MYAEKLDDGTYLIHFSDGTLIIVTEKPGPEQRSVKIDVQVDSDDATGPDQKDITISTRRHMHNLKDLLERKPETHLNTRCSECGKPYET